MKYTMLPNLVYESILTSNLTASEREIIILVNRYSAGFGLTTAYLSTQLIKSVIPINHTRIKQVVAKLIEKKVLNGKPIRQRKNGAVYVYELAINLDVNSWNVKQELHKKSLINEISHLAILRKTNSREVAYILDKTRVDVFKPNLQPDSAPVPEFQLAF